MREIKQAAAVEAMVFLADGADHLSGLAGLTPAVSISKNGGPFSAVTPTVADRGDGWYAVSLTAAHTDTTGDLVVRATAPGADPGERLLSVYSTKDADVLRVAGADQSPRDLGGKLDHIGLSSRLLFARGTGDSFWFDLRCDMQLEGTLKFRLASVAGGVLVPYLELGTFGSEGFSPNPALVGDQTVYEGYVCLDVSEVTTIREGIVFVSFCDSNYTDLAYWMPRLSEGSGELYYFGANGTFVRTADGERLDAIQRPGFGSEPTAYGTNKRTFGQLLAAAQRSFAASFVCLDGLGAAADLAASTDRPLPEGVFVYVFASSLLEAGSVYVGTLSSSGWTPEVLESPLGERMALYVGVSVGEGATLRPTALTLDWPGRAQPAKVYLPGKEDQGWMDMTFHAITGQPMQFGSGAFTGASLAETQSTPSRRAVIIGA